MHTRVQYGVQLNLFGLITAETMALLYRRRPQSNMLAMVLRVEARQVRSHNESTKFRKHLVIFPFDFA